LEKKVPSRGSDSGGEQGGREMNLNIQIEKQASALIQITSGTASITRKKGGENRERLGIKEAGREEIYRRDLTKGKS